MRPSAPVESGMPTGKKYMGWWGDFGGPKQKGLIQYSISPFQQNPMKGALHGYLFFGFKRIMARMTYFGIPFAAGYGIYSWSVAKNEFYNSKEGHRLLAEHEE
ncbi:Ubiquinol cytochrome c reductase, subunit QCR8 [Ceraceosorus bombacis]|uniref:Cytochrome b-c1 complex subunit 8 n=1 Tax=Ceraceosorus bombacis TaxID=401625 RepID=A0A0P1BGF3_9BASI|nr:Ubiquinol cytochrome c reductase, subunit QCR8 [Ceraceosorus bombacis]